METDVTRAIREAEEMAHGRTDGFLEGLASRLGFSARAGAVFGDPVERGTVTVIPVAKVRYGFGGGSGTATKDSDSGAKQDEGSGGGGGVAASPVGFIEIRDGAAVYKPITEPMASVPVIIASGFTAWLALRGLRALLR